MTDTKAVPFIDRNVSDIFIHPNYKNSHVEQGFDIALLRLDRSINYQKNIIPLCLPTENDIFTSNQKRQLSKYQFKTFLTLSSIKFGNNFLLKNEI